MADNKPPAAGRGRPKGALNKNTAALKDMILNALAKAGGEQYLVDQAESNPKAFLTLVGKVVPLQLTGPGADGEHLHSLEVRFVRPNG